MATVHESSVRRFLHKLRGILFLRRFTFLLAIYGFLWGTCVLVMRAGWDMDRLLLLWGLAGVPVLAAASVANAFRRSPEPEAIRALLDERNLAGGMLMASGEVEVGAWKSGIAEPRLPGLSWRWGKSGLVLAASTGFVALAFLTPKALAGFEAAHPLEVSREVEELAGQIELLKEEHILNEEKAKELEQKLGDLKEEAAGKDPGKTWEALDHLKNVTSQEANEAAEEALKDVQEMSKVETLAEAMARDAGELTAEQRAEAMKELAAMAEAAAKECEGLGEELPKELAEALEKCSLTPEQMKELAEILKECQGNLSERLSKLAEAGLIDGEVVRLCEEASEGEPGEAGDLAAYLSENGGDMSMGEMLDSYLDGQPGRGGVTRGRGDAPMTWSGGTSQEDVRFKKEVLPPAGVADLKKSELAEVSTGTPKTDETEVSTGGALGGVAASGGSARTRVILPTHRGTVKRYFDRTAGESGTPKTKGQDKP